MEGQVRQTKSGNLARFLDFKQLITYINIIYAGLGIGS